MTGRRQSRQQRHRGGRQIEPALETAVLCWQAELSAASLLAWGGLGRQHFVQHAGVEGARMPVIVEMDPAELVDAPAPQRLGVESEQLQRCGIACQHPCLVVDHQHRMRHRVEDAQVQWIVALRAAELLELPQAQAGVAQADAQHRPRRHAGRRTGLQAQRQPSRHRLRLLIRRRLGQQGLKRLPMFRADQRAHRPPRLQSGAEQLRRRGVEAAHQAVAVVHQDGGIGHERSQQVRGHGGGHENRNRVEKMKDVAERESGGSLAWMPGDLSRIARGQA